MEAYKAYYQYLMRRSALSLAVRSFFVRDFVDQFHGKVLDIGCGIGEFLERYPNSVGIDINPYLVLHCQKKGFKANLGDICHLPYADNSFDGILISNVIEHLANAEEAVQEAVRILKPGGILGLSCPYEAGFRHDPTHVRMFRKADLQRLAQNCQLKVKKIYSFPWGGGVLGKLLYFYELRAIFEKSKKGSSIH